MVKTIAIFGSTGTIGVNTINIINNSPNKFKTEILVAHSNIELLAQQALALKPTYVGIVDETKLAELKILLHNSNIEIVAGKQAVNELAKIKVDLVMMAIVGSEAIEPTINAIEAKNNLAIANKECLVCAGNLIMKLARQHKIIIIPVDSEHNGLFQIFDHQRPHLIKDITLTASGGPFRDYSIEQMEHITKAQALKHPNWTMGAKISIDSASLVNKCLEVIEAYHLFPLQTEQIKIVIHPESIMHALATYQDGSILAQLSKPNMQIPIAYALHYPERAMLPEFNQFSLSDIGKLHFYSPDPQKFRSLAMLPSILNSIDSNASLVFNIANEVAVAAFLNDQINFNQITQVIEKTLDKIGSQKLENLEAIIEHINFVKKKALALIA